MASEIMGLINTLLLRVERLENVEWLKDGYIKEERVKTLKDRINQIDQELNHENNKQAQSPDTST